MPRQMTWLGSGTTGAMSASASGTREPSAAAAISTQSGPVESNVPTSGCGSRTISSPSCRAARVPSCVLIVSSLMGSGAGPRRTLSRRALPRRETLHHGPHGAPSESLVGSHGRRVAHELQQERVGETGAEDHPSGVLRGPAKVDPAETLLSAEVFGQRPDGLQRPRVRLLEVLPLL